MVEHGVRMDPAPSLDTDNPPSAQPNDDSPALARTTTMHSISSLWTISDSDEQGTKLELDELVALIRSHTSLQRAAILSTEGYKQRRNTILHRFLVLELRRQDRSPIWLRIDRRMHPETRMVSFLLASGKSPAYDTVRPTLSRVIWALEIRTDNWLSIRLFSQRTKIT